MGVRGLQYFLEQCCQSASPAVNIEELVDNYREEYRCQPVIVVDGSSCIRQLYGDLEWIGGGQLKQFAELVREFVEAFRNIGVRLVLFFDGPTFESKRRTWVERRMSTLEKIYTVLDSISRRIPSTSISKNLFHLPPGLGQLSRVIFENFCGCEVHQSLKECDEEIAEYARSHEVFAILGQDSDFVIFDTGSILYLSMLHLDLTTMTTRLYDRWELARFLRIQPTQLPMLATLMGNDIVTAQDLKYFHLNITKQSLSNQNVNFRRLVPNIAMYIRRLPLDRDSLHQELPKIAQESLGDRSRVGDILASLHSYDALPSRDYDREEQGRRDHWSQLVAEARKRHQSNKNPSMVYAIMSGLPFESSTSVEDFRKDDLPAFAIVTQPLRKRLYGILLQEKPLPPSGYHIVYEWCMAGPGSLDNAKEVRAELPIPPHPGLQALWTDKGDLLNVRWRLFVNSVSSKLDVSRVIDLPPYLIIPTLILYYINSESHCLEEWEIEAMLATASTIKYYDAARLANMQPDPMTPRAIRVANLIMRCTFILYILTAACGYPLGIKESAPWLFFDGKLFQFKYREAQSRSSLFQLCDKRGDVFQHFKRASSIVFNSPL